MKLVLTLILALATPALAYDKDALTASKQPCVTTEQATADIQASRKNCKVPLVREWTHVCKGEVVQNHVVQDDQSVYPDNFCPDRK